MVFGLEKWIFGGLSKLFQVEKISGRFSGYIFDLVFVDLVFVIVKVIVKANIREN